MKFIRMKYVVTVFAFGLSGQASADSIELVGGWASTRLHRTDGKEEPSIPFVSRHAATFGVRGDLDWGSHGGSQGMFELEARWVPRGGGVSFRQTYGYFGDYLEFSVRPAWRSGGRLAFTIGAGPAVSVRLRNRTGASLFSGPDGEDPDFGALKAVDLGLLGAAGLRLRTAGSFVASVQAQYTYGLTNLHELGSAGTPHDPHVFDFPGRGRTFSIVAGIGVSR